MLKVPVLLQHPFLVVFSTRYSRVPSSCDMPSRTPVWRHLVSGRLIHAHQSQLQLPGCPWAVPNKVTRQEEAGARLRADPCADLTDTSLFLRGCPGDPGTPEELAGGGKEFVGISHIETPERWGGPRRETKAAGPRGLKGLGKF